MLFANSLLDSSIFTYSKSMPVVLSETDRASACLQQVSSLMSLEIYCTLDAAMFVFIDVLNFSGASGVNFLLSTNAACVAWRICLVLVDFFIR